jgi:hypothetical protein
MKHIEVTEADAKQAVIVYKLLQEAKFEIKGDALSMAAEAQRWVVDIAKRLKEAKEPVAETPMEVEAPKRGRK